MSRPALLCLALLLPACSFDSAMSIDMGGAGELGVSPGGAQDIGYVRDVIEAGGIPSIGSWSAEGLFHEHDLPLSGPDCDEVLCPRAQAASVPALQQVVVQVGFGTNITAESFERRDLNLGLAVDISGSMADGKLDAMKVALHALADRMTPDDRVSLVAFDDAAELRMEMRVMDEAGVAALRREIDRLQTRGGTNIEAGLALAYAQVLPSASTTGDEDRVMLFTDAQPNVGATGVGSFTAQVRDHAELGVGTTVFGTGLDLGVELAEEMSEVRGGAYVYLPDKEAIRAAFDEDFDYLVTPVAYDFEAHIDPDSGWRFVDAVGASLDDGAGDGGLAGVDFGASTLFLSGGGGGIALVLQRRVDDIDAPLPEAGEALARFDLRFVTADDSREVVDELELTFQGGTAWHSEGLGAESPYADDLGVYKMSMLLDEVDALTAAGMFCAGSLSRADALEAAQDAARRLQVVGGELEDAPLAAEAALMERLVGNLAGGQANCR